MYRAIVRMQVRRAWASMARGDWQSVLDGFADRFEYEFPGTHALGGVRHTKAAQAEWFARLFRLFPDFQPTLTGVVVGGWPWRTHAVAVLEVRLGDEAGYLNHVLQLLEIRWGKLVRVRTVEDTQKVAAALERRAAAGAEEAGAAPIES